jgi:hypothetical protein
LKEHVERHSVSVPEAMSVCERSGGAGCQASPFGELLALAHPPSSDPERELLRADPRSEDALEDPVDWTKRLNE